MNEYTCYTKQGKWNFYAEVLKDAVRAATFYCWRDGEEFDRIVTPDGHTVRLCIVDKDGWVQTI